MRIPTYTEVERLLADEDPQGLVRMGAPADEYRPEAVFVVDWLNKTLAEKHAVKCSEHFNIDEIRDLLYATFVLHFGHDIAGPHPSYEKPARALLALTDRR